MYKYSNSEDVVLNNIIISKEFAKIFKNLNNVNYEIATTFLNIIKFLIIDENYSDKNVVLEIKKKLNKNNDNLNNDDFNSIFFIIKDTLNTEVNAERKDEIENKINTKVNVKRKDETENKINTKANVKKKDEIKTMITDENLKKENVEDVNLNLKHELH